MQVVGSTKYIIINNSLTLQNNYHAYLTLCRTEEKIIWKIFPLSEKITYLDLSK